MNEIEQLKSEIVMLTNRDETPGLRYFEFWSKTMGFDVAAGVKLKADETDETGPFWAVEVCEIWVGIYNVTAFLHPAVLACVTAEACAHIGPELDEHEAIKRAALAVKGMKC
jgi:hypothetical protein